MIKQTGLLNQDMATDLGEGKPVVTLLRIYIVLYPTRWVYTNNKNIQIIEMT